jgi:hydroxymethyl cephem carbamoyltransferase
MLVFAVGPGHDGSVAVLKDGKLELSLEAEKDSFRRHAHLTATMLLNAVERVDAVPDVFALSGWSKSLVFGNPRIGAGYGPIERIIDTYKKLFGREVRWYSSTHERAHLMMAIGMAPRDESSARAVLIWEGALGRFLLLDERNAVVRKIPVKNEPGVRYGFLFALADPTFPDNATVSRFEDAGKLMALAAYGDPGKVDESAIETIDRMLSLPSLIRAKRDFRDSPLYNVGVEADVTKHAAALLTNRLFEMFARAAEEQLPTGVPLHISGGCGLNCDWNSMWRDHGQFSSVFVPPCTNDTGSALGTAIDAQASLTGDPYIEWDVYSGLEFEHDAEPDPQRWQRQDLRLEAVSDALAGGRIFAWVQGRWEIGPRALGNRSILAEPFDPRTRDRLNEIKQREGYRPIAPCCRIEDAGKAFDQDFEDPYMLYFRTVRSDQQLGAITHVDGSARCQTVSKETNKPLYELLSTFAARHGIGVLCNTSLNFKGYGFINKMADLVKYCEDRGINDFVVGDDWFTRREGEKSSAGD